MAEIDTDTTDLETSIDATAEQQLAMSAQFGSQAQAFADQLDVRAVEQREEYVEQVSDFAGAENADVMAELTSDYDTILSGIQNEMALAQQATIQNLQFQTQATQNYLQTMAAQLPALEERLQAQIEMAKGLGGSTGGRGPSGPSSDGMLFGDGQPNLGLLTPNASQTTPGQGGDPNIVENPYGEYWGLERTDEEKAAIAKELGMEVGQVFTGHGIAPWADVAGHKDWHNWFWREIAGNFGYDQDELQATYDKIWGTEVTIEGDEVSGQPTWYLNEGVSMITSLIADGMDPRIAHDYTRAHIMGKLEDQYGEYFEHDPDQVDRTIQNLDFILNAHYQGALFTAGMPMDYELMGYPGDTNEDGNIESVWSNHNMDDVKLTNDHKDVIERGEELRNFQTNREDPINIGQEQALINRFNPPERPEGGMTGDPSVALWSLIDEAEKLREEQEERERLDQADNLAGLRPPPMELDPTVDWLGLEETGKLAETAKVMEALGANVDWSGVGEGVIPTPPTPTDAASEVKKIDAQTGTYTRGGYPQVGSEGRKGGYPQVDSQSVEEGLKSAEVAKGLGYDIDFTEANEEIDRFLKAKQLQKEQQLAQEAWSTGVKTPPQGGYPQVKGQGFKGGYPQIKAPTKSKTETQNPQINSLIRSQQARDARKYANFRFF